MKVYKAVVLEAFGAPDEYHPGSPLSVTKYEEYPGYYWIVKNAKRTRDLIVNGSKELFRIVDDLKKAS